VSAPPEYMARTRRQTALHIACSREQFGEPSPADAAMVRLLLRFGCVPSATLPSEPQSHLERALITRTAAGLGFLSLPSPEPDSCVWTAHRGDPNLRDDAGDTPLHAAAARGDLEAARLLLRAGARHTVVNTAGATPVQLLPRECSPALEEMLLSGDAS
jgi:ankyrin repeat protein